MDRDLYHTLGVNRTASQDDIKKAYRKLARTYHPDFNPDDPIADRKFREVQEAYEIIGDPARRAQYDRHGMSSFRRGEGNAPRPPRDIFNEYMENLLKQRKPSRKRGEDLKFYLTVSLEEAFHGAEKQISVPRELECETCRGTGADRADGKVPCEQCQGLGELKPQGTLFNFARPCPTCRGTGYRLVIRCTGCDGRGRLTHREELKVRIPAGVDTGQRLRLKQKGNAGHLGGDAGDLLVIVTVQHHQGFTRHGAELLSDVNINFAKAALGGSLEVATLTGKAQIELPAGVQTGRLFRLKGQGMPKLQGAGRGDLHLRIVVETPTHLSPEQRKILEDLARTSDPTHKAPPAGVFDRLRSRLHRDG